MLFRIQDRLSKRRLRSGLGAQRFFDFARHVVFVDDNLRQMRQSGFEVIKRHSPSRFAKVDNPSMQGVAISFDLLLFGFPIGKRLASHFSDGRDFIARLLSQFVASGDDLLRVFDNCLAGVIQRRLGFDNLRGQRAASIATLLLAHVKHGAFDALTHLGE